LSEEQIHQFEDFFTSIYNIRMWDGTLGSLVREIAEPYFAGDKTLDETVDLIQRRVALYVNEAK
ncbi:MAG: hypothetical protein K2N78_08975, partial [Oscillospiraceae bacterium]|nr:hypothetical protein [Oscillospiraceae bacterium]